MRKDNDIVGCLLIVLGGTLAGIFAGLIGALVFAISCRGR